MALEAVGEAELGQSSTPAAIVLCHERERSLQEIDAAATFELSTSLTPAAQKAFACFIRKLFQSLSIRIELLPEEIGPLEVVSDDLVDLARALLEIILQPPREALVQLGSR